MDIDRELHQATGQAVRVTDDRLEIDLVDGRTITMPLVWSPRLAHATGEERTNIEYIGGDHESFSGLYWPDLDEYISIRGILLGRRSGESQASLERWISDRQAAGRGRSPENAAA